MTRNNEQSCTRQSKRSRPTFESAPKTTQQNCADEPTADSHQDEFHAAAEKQPNPAEKETSLRDTANPDSDGKSKLSPETYSVSTSLSSSDNRSDLRKPHRRPSRRYHNIRKSALQIVEGALRSTYARLIAMLLVSCAIECIFRLVAYGVPELSPMMCYYMRIGRGIVWAAIVRELTGSLSVSIALKSTKIAATREIAALLLGFGIGFNMPC